MSIAIIGTCDTKLNELLFLREKLVALGASDVMLIDVGRSVTNNEHITFKQDVVARFRQQTSEASNQESGSVSSLSRADLLSHMTSEGTALVANLYAENKIAGLISAGGSGGTSIASTIMRNAVPIGFPKLIVSTVASGDTGPIVGETDIMMLYSVVDIAGMNSVLRSVLTSAAGAMVGMVGARMHLNLEKTRQTHAPNSKRPLRVAITMFGVTTPCVTACQSLLAREPTLLSRFSTVEPYIFHATGHGGLAMERLIREGVIDAVIDATTTEIPDHLMGGIMPAGPNRLSAALSRGLPCIISTGACDMVNFGSVDTVPERYRDRQLMKHNANITLMRTSLEENKAIGEFISHKIVSEAKDPNLVTVVLPMAGVSIVSEPGGEFEDHEADLALFKSIEDGVKSKNVKVLQSTLGMNEDGFAKVLVEELVKLLSTKDVSYK